MKPLMNDGIVRCREMIPNCPTIALLFKSGIFSLLNGRLIGAAIWRFCQRRIYGPVAVFVGTGGVLGTHTNITNELYDYGGAIPNILINFVE
jgi:hypothetical protein